MSAQSPSESVPPQPPKAAAYSAAAATGAKPNPITRNLSEFAVADTPGSSYEQGSSPSGDYLTARRTASDQSSSSDMKPPERGVHGGAPIDQRERRETRYSSGDAQFEAGGGEGEKMAPPSEGKVAEAVRHRRGTSGSPHGRGRGEFSFEGEEGDLERKKAQQEVMRTQVMDARKRGEDVDGRNEMGGAGGREQLNLA